MREGRAFDLFLNLPYKQTKQKQNLIKTPVKWLSDWGTILSLGSHKDARG